VEQLPEEQPVHEDSCDCFTPDPPKLAAAGTFRVFSEAHLGQLCFLFAAERETSFSNFSPHPSQQ